MCAARRYGNQVLNMVHKRCILTHPLNAMPQEGIRVLVQDDVAQLQDEEGP